MAYRSYEWKIIYVLVIVFALIQAGVFVGLSRQNKDIARETLELELSTGAEVLDRLLRLRHRQLEQSARVLAADVNIRDAILRDDVVTAEALLREHEGRVASAAMVLTDSADELLAVIPSERHFLDPQKVTLRSAEFSQTSHDPLVTVLDGAIMYQIITVPVSSNLPIAWLTIGFPIEDYVVQTLDNVANTLFSFLSHQPGGEWTEYVSTFPRDDLAVLLPQFSRVSTGSQVLEAARDDYIVMPFLLSRFEDVELVAMVGKSLDQAMRPFNRLQRDLLFWVLAGSLISAVAIFLVTRRMVGPLSDMAHVDPLTGLANRRVFDVALNKMGSSAGSDAGVSVPPFGVLLMDMEGFRQINEKLGHTAGDEVLKIIAARLRDSLRKSDVIARYGGDEFAVLMPNADHEACSRVAEMILESLERKIPVDGREVEVGICIGIAVSPQDGRDRSTLLRKADLAMHAACDSGRGFAFYNQCSDLQS